jgi:rubredoxin
VVEEFVCVGLVWNGAVVEEFVCRVCGMGRWLRNLCVGFWNGAVVEEFVCRVCEMGRWLVEEEGGVWKKRRGGRAECGDAVLK